MSKDPTPENGKGKARRARFPWRFLGDRRGSTAIEFAMLAGPFAALVFAILESCISFAGQEVMANITDDLARQFRTGQLKQAGMDETKLKGLICGRLEIVVGTDCPDRLMVDLRAFPTFAAAADAGFSIANGTVELTGVADKNFQVNPGLAESKNMLRVFYKWPVMTDFLAKYMANLGGDTLHFASVTWQNEPFDD